jgi:hypothetical protein
MKFTKALPLVLLTAVSIGNLSANEVVADKKKFEPPVNRYGKSTASKQIEINQDN